MQTYLTPILFAVLVFPLVAALFTLPYVIRQYRKYGSISFLRTIIVFSFILYLISAYFLVILPLPSIESVAKLTTPTMQLIPFNFIYDFLSHTCLVITDISTYLPAIKEPYFYNVIFNIIITIPFGIYLRYYFKCSLGKTITLTFLLSLFFELTQLSALYGIYSRPYRLFDVDDLITNTLGGLIGYLIMPLFNFILPSRDKIDEKSYEKGMKVSYSRRIIALMIDWFFINVIFILTIIINPFNPPNGLVYIIISILYFIILSWISKGKTIGKSIVRIKIATTDNNAPKLYQYIIRYLILYLIVFIPIFCFYIIYKGFYIFEMIICIILIIVYIKYMFKIFISVINKKESIFYEDISHTKQISTIKNEYIKEIENEEKSSQY